MRACLLIGRGGIVCWRSDQVAKRGCGRHFEPAAQIVPERVAMLGSVDNLSLRHGGLGEME